MRNRSREARLTVPVRPDLFSRVSRWTIRATGGRWGFVTAVGVIVLWAVSGPYFQYSDYWQLVINTGTTIVTFLMVFLIQNAQNRESRAVHLKLDELIRAVKTAENEMIDIEDLSEADLDRLALRYHKIAAVHRDLELRGKVVHHDPSPGPRAEGVTDGHHGLMDHS